MSLYPLLQSWLAARVQEEALIPQERKERLLRIAEYIRARLQQGLTAHLNYICTHNSRRSHFGQFSASAAAAYFGVPGVETWSGGSEMTEINPRSVAALQRAGWQVQALGQGGNPHYAVTAGADLPTQEAFSKKFDDPYNPQQEFAAIMVCGAADEACPFVAGADVRITTTFEDPKQADGTPEESQVYDLRLVEVAREQLFVMSQVQGQ